MFLVFGQKPMSRRQEVSDTKLNTVPFNRVFGYLFLGYFKHYLLFFWPSIQLIYVCSLYFNKKFNRGGENINQIHMSHDKLTLHVKFSFYLLTYLYILLLYYNCYLGFIPRKIYIPVNLTNKSQSKPDMVTHAR